jgi:hypothetical protein
MRRDICSADARRRKKSKYGIYTSPKNREKWGTPARFISTDVIPNRVEDAVRNLLLRQVGVRKSRFLTGAAHRFGMTSMMAGCVVRR